MGRMIPSLFYAVGVRKSLDVHLWYKKREKKTSDNQGKVIVLNSVFLYQLMQGAVQIMGVYAPVFLHSTNQNYSVFHYLIYRLAPSSISTNQPLPIPSIVPSYMAMTAAAKRKRKLIRYIKYKLF